MDDDLVDPFHRGNVDTEVLRTYKTIHRLNCVNTHYMFGDLLLQNFRSDSSTSRDKLWLIQVSRICHLASNDALMHCICRLYRPAQSVG